MHTLLNAIGIITFIVSFIITGILSYSISRIVGSKGYPTSWGTKPSEFVNFIRLIRKEKDKKEKRDYIGILIAHLFFSILSIVLFFMIA